MYCKKWIENTEYFPVKGLSTQRISELLNKIKPQEKMSFFYNGVKRE